MKISQIHGKFSLELNNPKALTNPEDFLGPNWEDVINFWFYIETLSRDERGRIANSYWALDSAEWFSAWRSASVLADGVVGEKVRDAACCAAYFADGWQIFRDATLELIAHHKLLEQDKALVFLPLCLKT
jgi:hypothetical protein